MPHVQQMPHDSSNQNKNQFSKVQLNQKYLKLKSVHFESPEIANLEISQYLEKQLWPAFQDGVEDSFEHLMMIVLLINEKFRERVAVWNIFENDGQKFASFFNQITRLAINQNANHKADLSIGEHLILIMFFINCFSSIEQDLVRNQLAKYVAPSIWLCIAERRRQQEISSIPRLKKYFKSLETKDAKLNAQQKEQVNHERQFLFNYTKQFLQILDSITDSNMPEPQKIYISYCERFLEFLIDLESMSLTRRFYNVIIDEMHLIIHCQNSYLSTCQPKGDLFNQLIEILKFYVRFEIDSLSGKELTSKEIAKNHYDKVVRLQKIVFQNFPNLKDFYLSCVSQIDTPTTLSQYLNQLNEQEFNQLASTLFSESIINQYDRDFIVKVIIFSYERYESQLDRLNQMPLYPTEDIIWDENIVPSQYYKGRSCLALPKLNLQFLSFHDYLLRNFLLFRLESTYQIRQDIESSVSRLKPWMNEDNQVLFAGWSRMALPIDNFAVTYIGKPKLGEKAPSTVKAEVRVALSVRNEVKREWQALRKHDVCFLITIQPKNSSPQVYNVKQSFVSQVGLVHVRGCEVEGMLDSNGKLIDDNTEEEPTFQNDYRTYRVWLDANQYLKDMQSNESFYDSFNVIMRRKPKENNFKAVLETIKELMNTECVVPEWIRDILLGYGDPSSAHYSELECRLNQLDFNDTFIDFDHLKQSFPNHEIVWSDDKSSDQRQPPFKLTFANPRQIHVQSYVPVSRGPYKHLQPKRNQIRFTATQVEGIHSGMQPGLTLIVGPPGTGKTDVAVQIISNLYHNFPNQRTLIVTHSNQALNQLFEKIIHLDIDERHLLRLGHGEDALETDKDFTRFGRVDYVLNQRLYLLFLVNKLAKCLNVQGDVGYTCETASYFFLHHVLSRYEQFNERLSKLNRNDTIDWNQLFPFTDFFDDCEQPLFNGDTFEANYEICRSCYRYIRRIFTILEEFRAFEMLRTGTDRSNYLLLREAKIIAMTCTHAALKRKELVQLGFQYDNILMEEAAQILEIETFIPVLLQNPLHGHNRLKRWIMIGDHNQLPPVIKNIAFQKFSNMEQSLFARFVRLGVPKITLDAQGRARPSLCSLYRWKYDKLDDLSHVVNVPEFQRPNVGFKHDYQFIDVQDFDGVGESEPVPYFYQNLAEAEFAVATFMYMRLLGYPANSISILTTYNGQKHLIRDVIEQRCSPNPLIGKPFKVTTVDKFQGLQSDYIILSLVRTKNIGHLRDVRRLIVAMSRARLGLYIFGRFNLFAQCIEMKPVFDLLRKQSTLVLHPHEYYPQTFCDRNDPAESVTIDHMQQMVQFVFDQFRRTIEYWKEKDPVMLEKIVRQLKPNDAADQQTQSQPETQPETEQEPQVQPNPMDDNAGDNDDQDEDNAPFEKLNKSDTGLQEQADIVLDEE